MPELLLGDPSRNTNDLSSQYLNTRNVDPEEFDFQRELQEARRKDQEEEEFNTLSDMPKVAEDWTPPKAGEPGSPEARASQESQVLPVNMGEHPFVKFVKKTPGNVTKGVWKAAEETTNFLVGQENVQALDQELRQMVPGYADLDNASRRLYQELGGKGMDDQLVQVGAQFLVPFTAWYKGLSATTQVTSAAGKVAAGFSADAIASYTAFEPQMERFSPLLKEFGLENDFINYLSDQSGSDAEERFKNAVDSVGAGAIFGPILFAGGQMLKRGYYALKGIEPPKPREFAQLKGKYFELDPAKAKEIKQEFTRTQGGTDTAHAIELATPAQKDLAVAGFEIAKTVGAKFKDPGVKSFERAQQKVEAGKPVQELTDLARGGFIVDTEKQANQIIKGLKDRFDIVDEGVAVSPAGYFDRKVMVRLPNGTVGEIQVMEKNLAAAKMEGGGHDLYQALGDLTHRAGPNKGRPLPGKEKEALINQSDQFGLYFNAARKAGKDWQRIYEKNLDKDMLDYLGLDYGTVTKALKSDSDITLPFSSTSSRGTAAHSPDLKTKPSIGDSPLETPTNTPGSPSNDAGLSKSASSGKGGLPGKSIDTSSSGPGDLITARDSIAKVKEFIKDFQPLKEAKSRYFTRPKGTQDIPIDKIQPTRAREGGIQRGYQAMNKAYAGEGGKRKPISLVDMGDGSYRVLDGNSTFANAAASGWKKIPAKIIKIDPDAMVREKVMVGGVEKTVKIKGSEALRLLGSGADLELAL